MLLLQFMIIDLSLNPLLLAYYINYVIELYIVDILKAINAKNIIRNFVDGVKLLPK